MPESQVPMQVPEQQEDFGASSSHTATIMVASRDKTASNNVMLSQLVVLSNNSNRKLYQSQNNVNSHLKTDQTPSVDQHH